MNVEFQYWDDFQDGKMPNYYSTNFPLVNFRVGDSFFLHDWSEFLKVGQLYMPSEDALDTYVPLKDLIDGNSIVKSFTHGYEKGVGYVLIIQCQFQ